MVEHKIYFHNSNFTVIKGLKIFSLITEMENHMSTVTNNSTITITYKGKLDNGEVFKSVDENSPFTLRLGNQELPPTVENALIGHSVGDTIKVRVSPEEGYGGRQKLLVQKINKKSLGDTIVPKPGMILSLTVSKLSS